MRKLTVSLAFVCLILSVGFVYNLIEIREIAQSDGASVFPDTNISPAFFRLTAGGDLKADAEESVVDVRTFGAKADGIADDTGAVQSAINSLGNNGGTVLLKGNFVIGNLTFASVRSNWLVLSLEGSMKLKTTLNLPSLVALVGKGGGTPVQFQNIPSATIIPPPGNVPAIKRTGIGGYGYIANISIHGLNGPGILLQNGALAYLENIGIIGRSPIVIDGFFWVWMKNCSFLSTPPGDASIYITTTPGLTYQSAIFYMDDLIIAGAGIKVAAQTRVNIQGYMKIRNIVYETGRNAFLTLNGTNGTISHIELDTVGIADPISVPSVITVLAGPVRNVSITNSDVGIANIPWVSGQTSIYGLSIKSGTIFDFPFGWNIGANQNNYTLERFGAFYGQWSGQGASMSPSFIPYAPFNVSQEPSNWVALSGDATVTTGVLGPDGTPTAGKLSTKLSGTHWKTIFSQAVNFAFGDWIIAGYWVKSDSSTVYPSIQSVILFSDVSFRFDNDVHSFNVANDASRQVGSSWVPVVVAHKLIKTGTNPGSISFNLGVDSVRPTSFWMPFMIHIPASARITDTEIKRWAKYLTNIPSTAPAGSIALFPHQKLWGANLIDSRGISATATSANNLRGSLTISDTATSGAVTFDRPESDANYFLTVTPTTIVGSPQLGSNRIRSITKTKSNFTVELELAPGKGNDVKFDWHLIR